MTDGNGIPIVAHTTPANQHDVTELLALVNDPEGSVEVLIDRELWQGQDIQAHPLVNTATVVMSIADMERFILHSGHEIRFVDVP